LVARREILIDAPVEVVWSVVTEPEHIGRWFSDAVELDLRPGGEMILGWNEHGTVHGRIERVERPRLFSFRWAVHPELAGEGNWTLVEFSLLAEGDSTRLTVVESGFRELDVPGDEQERHLDAHRRGWELELGELEDYLRERTRR
jgi:uncharacterized protein YndB with AHSA1/START domain